MKPVVIYDLFSDASVGPELRGSCAGVVITRRPCSIIEYNKMPDFMFEHCIIPDGTNNAGESCGVAMAVSIAYDLYRYSIPYDVYMIVNIFSDSLITINGVRDWLPGWIEKMDQQGNLKNASNQIVANQEHFKFIFNSIVTNPADNFHINFIHQKGHVSNDVNRMIDTFRKTNNGLSPKAVGLTALQMCSCNDYVDKETRSIINMYLSTPIDQRPLEWNDTVLKTKCNKYKNYNIIDNSIHAINLYKFNTKFIMNLQ